MTTISWTWLGILIIGILLFIFYIKTERFLKCLIFTAFTGIGALGVLWIAGKFIIVPVAITPLSVAVCALLGVPGALTMLIINLI